MSFQKKRRFQQKPKARAHALGIECLESRRMLAGPYAPAAGIEGSTAVHHLDVRIEGWASEVVQYLPGSEVNAEFQDTAQALGPADSTSGGVVSLGRGGSITVGFLNPIRDGLGFDFAVFENGFMDTFLELGKVQVSSDGINFFEFDSDSMTSDPVGSFGSVDPTEIDGFAGKYRVGFGTPFDLASLDGIDPRLDVNRVTHVRIIDVIGDGTAFDSQGDPIYDPFPTVNSAGFDLDGVAVLHGLDTGEDFVGFEDVGASLGTNGSFSGPVTGGEESEGEFGERITRGSFESGGLEFNNSHSNFLDYGFTSWSQWAYSNITDNVTAGYTNQFGVITGEAAAGSDTFGVAFVQQGEDATPPIIRKKVSDERQFGSLFVTNTTYAALSMRDGDQFAKAFGGATGDDEDFFRLTITGKDDLGSTIGSIEVYLADYRFENNAEDYILDEWLQVDLTAVATAESLEFSVDSSDVGDSGMNTPAYFAVDQIRLTEPTLFFDVDPDSITEDASVNTAAARVTRLYSDKTTALEIDVSSDVFGILDFPSSITIPAGQDYHDFTIEVIGDDLYRGDQSVVLAASVTDVGSDTASLQVIEDDPLSLQLNTAVTGIVEGNTISVAVSRNAVDLGSALAVSLTADSLGLLDVPDEVVIPLGESSVLFNVVATEDLLDRPNESLPISANADGYLESSITLNWEDNDDPELNITSQKITYSEVEALPTVGFELLGRSIEKEGYRNGSDVNGGYETKGMLLNNSYDPEWDSWSGWSISKTTDTTTPGFLNQYSSIVGQGDSGSETYAVGAVGFATVPSIVRNLGSTSSFHSVSITNTTYAVRSMLEGDFFAKKFGGETGNDPDWLLLTIEGLDAQQQSIGTLDFYLADYRFEDNQDDYIVDSWVNVPLDDITEAAELRFSMTSSDTGQYGMNTPAYFAIDQLKTVSQTASPHVQISRNTFDVATDLVVNINSSDVTEVSDIGAVKIPAGQRTISVPLPLLHDELVDGDKSVLITATSDGFASSELNLNIADSDTAQLTLSLLSETASEAGDSVQLLVHRNQEDLGQGVEVALESSPANQLNLANSIELAVGERSALTSVQALDNEIRDGDRTVTITGTASGFSAGTEELIVIDDERVLQLSMGNSQVKEADARPLSSFEDFGAKLPADSYFDGRRQSGEFLTDDVILNNEFNPTYSSWTGWAISNTTDTETAGYQNQFSSIAGTGAVGTSTYAVAYVSPGFSIPEMVISDELPDATFDSIMVSNTTYAYLSMLNGDFFGKKFGGEDGTDPDYFSLKIKGYNAAGEDVGEVEFMLADYRSSDSSEDYLAEGWNRIDLSGLTGARSLGFELDSSDIGEYGMNTPSYFAVDHLVLSEPDYVPSYLTIDRDNDEVLEELTVQLSTDDSSEVEIPAEIVIPQGVSSYDVPIHVVDNFVADGDRTISLNAAAGGYLPGDLDLVIEDDDPAVLTLSVWSESQAYTEGDSVEFFLHRNDLALNELPVSISDVNDEFIIAESVITLGIGQDSALSSIDVKQNDVLEGGRSAAVTVNANGYSDSTAQVTITDDEVAGFDVQLSSDPLLLGELADGKVALVKLLSQPLGDVYVDLDLGSATADVVADKDELVFTSANWNVDQEVLFTAIPDLIIEEDELFAWSIAVNKTLSTALYSDAETANLSLKVLEENPTHMRIVSDSELIRLVDSSSGKVISERALLEGLQITANDLTQNVEISTIGRPRGSIEFDLAGGNDSATLFTGDFDGIDGGVGEDKLSLHLEEGFNFVEFLSNRVSSFETFDLQSGPIHIQSTGLQDLAVQGERLYLTLSQDQELTFSVDAALLSPTMYEGNFVHVIQLGAVEVMSQPGKPWRNPVDPYDVHVEHPGVSALDALVVINEIGRREDRTLSEISDLSEFGGNYFDVSGDGLLSALDAVQVINELARRSDRTSGEWIVPIFGNQVANDEGRIARYIDANNVGDPNSGPDSIAAQRLPAKAASDYAGDEIGSSRMKNTPPAGELGSNLELLDQVFALLAGETNEVPVS